MHDLPADDALSPQRQVELLKEQLARAQRLTAIGELTSTTTHEFNNVLMTIINYAKLGLRHQDAATRDRAFAKILDAGTRAARITSTILGMARNRSDAFEPTDLRQLVDDTLLLLERELAKYRVSVERQFQEAPPALVRGNQIQQVLVNLLVNARQAMPDGGRVIIKLLFDEANQMVDLVVRDTGTGIAPEVLRRIFDPFFSTKRGPDATGKGGTGLGLSACREIIEAHRGRIRVESTLGRGTAFTLKLPAALEPTAASPASLTRPAASFAPGQHGSPAATHTVRTSGEASPAT
ncbi:MAG: sensor histidine kinase [Pirellulales bacterium]|nr:sensor histidine kinase [Pirellulales bacterium]